MSLPDALSSWVSAYTSELFLVIVFLASAAWLLWLNPRHPATRALALLFVIRAGARLTLARIPEPALADALFRYVNALTPLTIVASIWFLSAYPHRRNWFRGPRRFLLHALFAAGLAVAALLFVHPELALEPKPLPDGGVSFGAMGPLILLNAAQQTMYAFVGYQLARDHTRLPPGPLRGSTLLVSVGFALTALTYSIQVAAPYFVGLAHPPDAEYEAMAWIFLGTAALALSPVALLVRERARGGASTRQAVGWSALFALAIVSTGYVLWTPGREAFPGELGIRVAIVNAWRLAMPILVGYALARHHLFGIDRKLHWTVSRGAVVAVYGGIYVVASSLALLALDPLWAHLTALAITASFLVAWNPVRRLGLAVTEAAFPTTEQPGGADARKLEVYRTALEAALDRDGSVAPADKAFLDGLRGRLGLTPRDHDVLLHGLQAARGLAPADALAPGVLVLDRYRLEAVLGEGADATTWRATDVARGRRVAVKAVRADPARAATLRHEARLLANLRDERIVRLLDAGGSGGDTFLVTEYVDGGSLADRLRDGRAPPFADVAEDLLGALAALHARGLVHRDVKPSNILVTRAGRCKLADFGVAQALEGSDGATDDRTLAASGRGTPRFMSPEQARGQPAGPASDLYSAAAVLHEVRTGRPWVAPRLGETPVETRLRVAAGTKPDSRAIRPAALGRWFARALDPSPKARFASALEMREALRVALRDGAGP